MVKRLDIPKSNLRMRRRKRRLIVAAILTSFVLTVFGVVVTFTWLPFVRIQTVTVVGQKSVLASDIEQLAQEELSGGYLYVFAKSNVFLYPKGFIHDKLLHQYPTFSSVQVRAKNFQTLGVTVVERQPVALWCGENVASSSGCYVLDETGIVYAPAAIYSGDAYEKYYGHVTGDSLPQQYLDPLRFHSLSEFVDALQKKGTARIQSVAVDESEDVHLKFDTDFTLIFTLDSETSDVFNRFELARTSDVFKTHKVSDFEYLDLRFGDKLYYKLKYQAGSTSTKAVSKPK